MRFECCFLLPRTRASHDKEISIEAAWPACPKSKDETHLLPLPLFVPISEHDPTDQCVGCGMSVCTKMLCDGKTRRTLGKTIFEENAFNEV